MPALRKEGDETQMSDEEYAVWLSDEEYAVCPVCGAKGPEWIYRRDGEILGCDDCIDRDLPEQVPSIWHTYDDEDPGMDDGKASWDKFVDDCIDECLKKTQRGS